MNNPPQWIESLAIILLGIIEGVTEFLPISSTGHLLIADKLLGTSQTDAFMVIIQAGAILAVVLIYWPRLREVFMNLGKAENRNYLAKLAVAFVVTAAGYKLLNRLWLEVFHKELQLPEEMTPVVSAVVIGAFIILWTENRWRKKPPTGLDITWNMAVWVGVAQILAGVFPGTSRSGATIIAAMLCGASRMAATEFSFLLSIPTMFAASAVKGHEAWEAGLFVPDEIAKLAVGFTISCITAFIVVKWLLHFVRSHTFVPFAWYRLVLAVMLVGTLHDELRDRHRPHDVDRASSGSAAAEAAPALDGPGAPAAEEPAGEEPGPAGGAGEDAGSAMPESNGTAEEPGSVSGEATEQ